MNAMEFLWAGQIISILVLLWIFGRGVNRHTVRAALAPIQIPIVRSFHRR